MAVVYVLMSAALFGASTPAAKVLVGSVQKTLFYPAGETLKPVNLGHHNRNRKLKGLGLKCVTYLKSLFFSAGEMPKPINLDRYDRPYTQLTREERDRYWRRDLAKLRLCLPHGHVRRDART